MANSVIQDTWFRELPSEVHFWRAWIRKEDTRWLDERAARLSRNTLLQEWVRDLVPTPAGGKVNLLDVGAGPATVLGSVWPRRVVHITAVDPLADEYNAILDEQHIEVPTKTIRGSGEQLTDLFSANTFDFVCSINALDHAYNPVRAIANMLLVVKPGRPVVLAHYVNEGEAEEYVGLHQWNFCLEDDAFVIWNRNCDKLKVADHLPHLSRMDTRVLQGEKAQLVVVLWKEEAGDAELAGG